MTSVGRYVPGQGWKDCAIRAFLAWLPDDDRATLGSMVDAPASVVRHTDLWRFSIAAYPEQAPPKQSWGRHRRGECGCGRRAIRNGEAN